MKATINTSLLARLKLSTKPFDVRDDKLTGFLVRVNISGKLLYMCEYARGKRVTIGRADALTPTQARDMALTILGDAAKGIDPKNVNKKPAGLTLQEFMKDHYTPWFLEHRKSGNKTIAHINRCFVKPFGETLLIDFTPASSINGARNASKMAAPLKQQTEMSPHLRLRYQKQYYGD